MRSLRSQFTEMEGNQDFVTVSELFIKSSPKPHLPFSVIQAIESLCVLASCFLITYNQKRIWINNVLDYGGKVVFEFL